MTSKEITDKITVNLNKIEFFADGNENMNLSYNVNGSLVLKLRTNGTVISLLKSTDGGSTWSSVWTK